VYFPALHGIFSDADAAPSVLELEPQTLWHRTLSNGNWRYSVPDDYLGSISALPQSKLVHGVGQPVGGSAPDPIEHFPLLRRTVDTLDPAWVSEHLSFMRLRTRSDVRETGFLLPPIQSDESVRVAAASIAHYRSEVGRPVAFETGVNYLRGRYGNLDDGSYFRRVSEAADSGILLDLHNLWCNHVNGRADIDDVLAQIPLDRVWEVHLAGGSSLDGVRLDAHCDAVPEDLLAKAADIIPTLNNLCAIVYEVMPADADRLGLDTVHEQLAALSDLWKLVAPVRVGVTAQCDSTLVAPASDSDRLAMDDWQQSLCQLLRSSDAGAASDDAGLAADPGIAVYRRLIADTRLGSLARVVRFTASILLIRLGRRAAHELFADYVSSTAAQSFAGVEGLQFCEYLRGLINANPANGLGAIPYLLDVMTYEQAVLRAAICGESTTVSWTVDPIPLFDALAAGRVPSVLPAAPQLMTVNAEV
jgi:uncharacterized protein